MFLNKLIPVMVCGLLLCLIAVNCERDLSTPHKSELGNFENEQIKDGVMMLKTYKRFELPDGSKGYLYDSLFVSETENRLEDIDNGILFHVPEWWNLEINFWGDFVGMPNKIFYLLRYKRKSKKYGIVEEWMEGEVPNSQTAVLLTSIGNTAFDIEGIIFCLDSDNEHSGTGLVIIEHDNIPVDTLSIDADSNTVVYGGKNAIKFPMALSNTDISVSVIMPDWYSFFDDNVRVAWFVEDESNKIGSFTVSPTQGQFLVEDYASKVAIWAFATKFVQLEEINDE